MDQRDFNRDMDSYLKDRTTSRGSGDGFLRKLRDMIPSVSFESEAQPEQQPPEQVPKEHVDAVLRGESLPETEEEILEEAGQEIEEAIAGPPFWQRFSRWLAELGLGSRVRDRDFDDSVPGAEEMDFESMDSSKKQAHVDTDVKEMLRICVHWVNMLPAEKIQDIKRSDDFVKFKQLLDKYGLLKKKD